MRRSAQNLSVLRALRSLPKILWCLPGGGVEPGASLPDNLRREVFEETGLTITGTTPTLINEFHDPETGFHQVEVVFRCEVTTGQFNPDWQDPEGVVRVQRLVTRAELQDLPLKPAAMKTLP
ncbi:MAG: NUDIX hydrolase [Rhodobacteraceae bacterium]|nr:NUDIX hydrolase [Paracoccaceae bacterium]